MVELDSDVSWNILVSDGLTTVVDPMIFRAGDLFCRGSSATPSPAESWRALSGNISGIAAFFDALIYNDKLPIFDYGITFPEWESVGAGTPYTLLPTVNADAEVLVPIQVHEAVHPDQRGSAGGVRRPAGGRRSGQGGDPGAHACVRVLVAARAWG
jgi:hypothetical protein